MRPFIPFAFLVVLFLSAPAMPASAAEGQSPLPVTVSIPPLRYFLNQIGGDAVSVTTMAAKGQDPHSYEPTAAQMAAITRAELYFTIGVPFETQWMPKFRQLNPSMQVVDLLDAVDRIKGKPDLALRDTLPGKGRRRAPGQEHGHEDHDHDHEHGHHHHGLDSDDPHAWLSPADMMRAIPLIAKALAEKRPELQQTFSERAETLTREVDALMLSIKDMLAPFGGKTFLTFHQSWAHYARNFNLREVSVELEGREPGPKSMAMLMDFAKANNIKVIVTDPMTPKASADAIARSLKAHIVRADPLAENWPGALLEFSRKLAGELAAEQP